MHSSSIPPQDAQGDFDRLFAELDTPAAAADIAHGYAELMARVASPDYRRRCGIISH